MSTTRPLPVSQTQALHAPALRAAVVAGALLAGAGGAWVLRTFDPTAAGSLFPPCVFHLFTGLWCPGCGITRALHALAHGDVLRAWAMNPLVVIALPLLGLMLWQWAVDRRVLPRPLHRVAHDGWVWIGVLLVFGVLRNLPWWPFAWMAPG
ncbi:DUF2752 domain-containing protein [Lysobacter sp.]|uniref:DUF2752 domain-containing protein n=1 Tax=Lysobacter sp. TaxID=72226 RepID=UPI002D4293C4|nr:DUF2752 domain-containing protein [Lysobacter sp.]HZX75809.1 DUF2752 domain-containing protein [Lysobacter sp.]